MALVSAWCAQTQEMNTVRWRRTSSGGCCMAMSAPMKNVLSPISQTRIIARLFKNACQKLAVRYLAGTKVRQQKWGKLSSMDSAVEARHRHGEAGANAAKLATNVLGVSNRPAEHSRDNA